ncbi:MAG: hypothetical protein C0154_16845 [Mucilaginibacter sp.]|nr:MAG: hypothetical protein C0154_16845 [Mucilaginibacter sp.]
MILTKSTNHLINTNTMDRQEFLSKLGIGMAVVCAGCALVSCSKNTPKPGEEQTTNPPPNNTGNLFTADLNSELTGVGTSKVSNGVILVRLAAANVPASFTAVQVACTHQGVDINYSTNQGLFVCPAHGSQFNTSGGVVQGPAATALKKYNISINGATLTVSA